MGAGSRRQATGGDWVVVGPDPLGWPGRWATGAGASRDLRS